MSGKDNWINLLGIVGIMVGILLLFNISNIMGNSKITSFNYSDDQFSFNATGADLVIDKDYKSNEKVYVKFTKNINSNSSLARDNYNSKVKNSSGQILSSYNKTNSNGVNVYCSVIKLLDPSTKTELVFYNFFIQDKAGQIHKISIFGDDTDNKINKTADSVYNSIKLN
jgi:hypothetical protein